ncbi:hypothetical protein [Clostridium baratii]|uniref:hypothetical protein n=1 Tax=Clostridium baratii TaxID=1561 RepID=UPI003D347011
MKKIIIGIIIAIVVVAGLLAVTEYENKQINNFKEYLQNKEGELSQYIIVSDEKEYKSLIKRSKKAIKYRNVQAMPKIQEKMDELVSKAQKEDEETLTKELNNIKNISLKKLSKEKRTEIENQIKEAEELIKNKQYREASKKITPLSTEIYNDISAN